MTLRFSFILILLCSFVVFAAAQKNKPAYAIYNSKGKSVNYDKMIKELAENDIVFFGELHNNSLGHWLELQVTKDLYDIKKDNLVLGAEMIEADDQLLIDEYLSGLISEKNFEAESHLWNNYKTDYKPLVTFARENGLPFIATNIPRRYANIIYKKGIDSLNMVSDEAKKYIAPLPIHFDLEVACYKNMMNMGGHGGENLAMAQAAKDATMAHFLLKNWSDGKLFLHYNGSYHSDNLEGIGWYVKHYQKERKITNITVVLQDDIENLEEEYEGKADFIIAIPSDMTSTY